MHARPQTDSGITERDPTAAQRPGCSARSINTLGEFAAVLDAQHVFRPAAREHTVHGVDVLARHIDRPVTLDAMARMLVPETHGWLIGALLTAAADGHVDVFDSACAAANGLSKHEDGPADGGGAASYSGVCSQEKRRAAALLVDRLVRSAIDGDNVDILDRLATAPLFGAGPVDMTGEDKMRRAFNAQSLGVIAYLHQLDAGSTHTDARPCCDVAMGDQAWHLASPSVIEWARRHNCSAYRPCTVKDVARAIRQGRSLMATWMLSNGAPHLERDDLWRAVCECACAGHAATIDAVIDAGLLSCRWPVLIGAAQGGHTALIDSISELGRLPQCACHPVPRDTLQAMLFAALPRNRLGVVEWIAACDPSLFNADVMWRAIVTSAPDTVRAVECVMTVPFDWQGALCLIMAKSTVSMLDLALSRGAVIDSALIVSALPMRDTLMVGHLCHVAGDGVMQHAVDMAYAVHGTRAASFACAVARRLPHLAYAQAVLHPYQPAPRPCECPGWADEAAARNDPDETPCDAGAAPLSVAFCGDASDRNGNAEAVDPMQGRQQRRQQIDRQPSRSATHTISAPDIRDQNAQGDGSELLPAEQGRDTDVASARTDDNDDDVSDHGERLVWTTRMLLRIALIGRRRRAHPPRDQRPRKRRRQLRALSLAIAV
ncbi:hypothetical protein pneo_cds_25 [Pandoravirus neocaledonia]|uniref:Ankyrin repeat domain containing protein n=1 Tax=Pandoravirus neocaledonia TaxID=2107708 RepID=A0A2U7UB55_9VIRU|nr:hypothetical protein pneo_cds_25 [Pandoravirus neocaledonia]AVK75632.1 hypothetical protein pneo_cds_25 [Pandoravirus neocaledonia]